MKKVFFLAAIIAASLFTTKGYSQVFVGGHVGLHVRVGLPVVAPAPVIIPAPAPVVYTEPAQVVVDPAVCADFPGYAYYDYPAWNGHFRDRIYFEHYRPVFVHAHPYYRSYYHGRRW